MCTVGSLTQRFSCGDDTDWWIWPFLGCGASGNQRFSRVHNWERAFIFFCSVSSSEGSLPPVLYQSPINNEYEIDEAVWINASVKSSLSLHLTQSAPSVPTFFWYTDSKWEYLRINSEHKGMWMKAIKFKSNKLILRFSNSIQINAKFKCSYASRPPLYHLLTLQKGASSHC